MTVQKLKEKCKEKGLKVSGTKKQLIERLQSPTSSDLVSPKLETVQVGLSWGDSRAKDVSRLIEKNSAKLMCYTTDKFIYEIKKDKWAEILTKHT